MILKVFGELFPHIVFRRLCVYFHPEFFSEFNEIKSDQKTSESELLSWCIRYDKNVLIGDLDFPPSWAIIPRM